MKNNQEESPSKNDKLQAALNEVKKHIEDIKQKDPGLSSHFFKENPKTLAETTNIVNECTKLLQEYNNSNEKNNTLYRYMA